MAGIWGGIGVWILLGFVEGFFVGILVFFVVFIFFSILLFFFLWSGEISCNSNTQMSRNKSIDDDDVDLLQLDVQE
jgi:uncharacterized membrane protein